ncbi:hypothetical protein ACDW82_17460 [Alcaligenes faecalis]|uniref:Uncharacterized protein n=2 Tax=Alcaligenes TaxID=507 RepID=A0ABY7N882_ALCFA|nr:MULTISPECIES: hypothetical protein [Alcaligenes]MBQ0218347.1 hypothetical protein [Alcaligenes faecalis]MBW4789909.1 hypothetical protein [Alcaligenes faecalis subsp. faecalis]MCB4324090.1 hypothetical protein [Alcaligenes sp. 13f]MCX5465568.1 hypothetical protein [Alcaligenes parafaecalis]MDT0218956.1 hypothetical protein [Alcaligenes sp. AB3]
MTHARQSSYACQGFSPAAEAALSRSVREGRSSAPASSLSQLLLLASGCRA